MVSHRIDKAANTKTINEMAEFMIENEPCSRDDLLSRFTKQDVETCEAKARDEAHRRRAQAHAA